LFKFAFFSIFRLEVRSCLASVTVDDVRDTINISASDISDAKVLKMIKRAEVMLSLELSK
jgi:hypothetical protein